MKNSFLLLSRLRSVLLALTLMIGCSFAFAQTKTISGTVTGSGLPLPGVNVKIKGGSTGAVTDFDGIYKIDAETGDILEFSSLGFKTQNVTVADNPKIDVTLVEDIDTLDEVVVIGYGTSTKKDLTGTVVSIKEEEINRTQPVSFEQALVANAPGVRVVTSEGGPGAGLKVQVRGNTSILASGDPLYVIDGFPVIDSGGNNIDVNAGNGFGAGGSSSTSPLANLDPADIQSIEVLKDASATAIYGARGANGVVLITTKSGQSGKATVTYSATLGVQRIARQVDLLGAQEYVDLFNEVAPFAPELVSSQRSEPFAFFSYRDKQGNPLSLSDQRLRVVDYRDLLFRDAIILKHNLSVSGGDDKSKYFASFGYLDQQGVLKNSEFVRYSANLKVSSKVSDRFKIGFNANLGLSKREGVPTSTFGSTGNNAANGIITQVLTAQPVIPNEERLAADSDPESIVRDPATGFITEFRRKSNNRLVRPANPLNIVDNIENFSNNYSVNANAFVEYELLKGLKFRSSLGGRIWANKGQNNVSIDIPYARDLGGIASIGQQQALTYLLENTLSYNKSFGSIHRFNALVGQTLQESQFESFGASSRGFFSPNVNLGDLNASDGDRQVRSFSANNSIESYLARFNYILKNRYFLTFSGRADGSSRFLPGSQWGYFPSAAIKWTVSEEEFLKNSSVISNLSFKASIGLSGNERIPGGIAQGVRTFSEADSPGIVPRVDNANLTWETTRQTDIGVEAAFLNNRIRLSANVFDKTTSDLLFFRPTGSADGRTIFVPGLGQQTGFFTNLGEISNKGLEVSIGGDVIKTKDFTWNANANITFSENLIEELEVQDDRLIFDSPFEPRVDDEYLLEAGKELGSFYGYVYDGVYRYEDFVEFDGLSEEESISLFRFGTPDVAANAGVINANRGEDTANRFTLKPGIARFQGASNPARPGSAKFKDLDGDGIVTADDDRTVIGSAQADHFGGFTNSFKYKNIDLSFQFNWSYGNDILNLNLNRNTGITNQSLGTNLLGLVRNRWTPSNNDTNVPSLSGRRATLGIDAFSDSSLLEDGSFLRLGNISIGYKLPKDMVKSLGLSSFKVFGAVDNVYVWSNYSGFDPDVSVGNIPLAPGTDFDAYPRARTFRMGIKAQF